MLILTANLITANSFHFDPHELVVYLDFDDVCYAIHDYIADNGYENLASWVEMAARSMGK